MQDNLLTSLSSAIISQNFELIQYFGITKYLKFRYDSISLGFPVFTADAIMLS